MCGARGRIELASRHRGRVAKARRCLARVLRWRTFAEGDLAELAARLEPNDGLVGTLSGADASATATMSLDDEVEAAFEHVEEMLVRSRFLNLLQREAGIAGSTHDDTERAGASWPARERKDAWPGILRTSPAVGNGCAPRSGCEHAGFRITGGERAVAKGALQRHGVLDHGDAKKAPG